jgi:transposase
VPAPVSGHGEEARSEPARPSPPEDTGSDDTDPDDTDPEDTDSDVDWDDLLTKLTDRPLEEGWVTLEEASRAAGTSRSTLRSWYRTGKIPSRMVAGPNGPQRIVPLDAVVEHSLRSSRTRRQLEHARSLEAEVDELRRRLEAIERHLDIG